MIYIVPPNFYIINEYACPPLQLEPFYNYVDAEIVHLKRGQKLETIPEDDFYGITAYTEDYPMAEIVARFLKHRNPQCRIALGGAHATYRPSEIDKNLFDDIVVGYGEAFIARLCGQNIPNTRNIKWDNRSFKHFIEYNPNYHRGSETSYTFRTSYGCPWNCYFCAKKFHQVQFRTIKDIENQLTFLAEHKIRNIRVIDEIFSLHPQFEDICKMLKVFEWNAQDRIDQLTSTKCKILSANGCRLVQVGIESFDAMVRQKLNKHLSDCSLEKGIKNAKDYGIQLNAFLMLGTPYDTPDIIKLNASKGIDLFGVGNLRPDIFVPLPGTQIGDNIKDMPLQILETDSKYYTTFPFQNSHGKIVSMPDSIIDRISWETLLFETLYELSSEKIKTVLDNPITNWYSDYENFKSDTKF